MHNTFSGQHWDDGPKHAIGFHLKGSLLDFRVFNKLFTYFIGLTAQIEMPV